VANLQKITRALKIPLWSAKITHEGKILMARCQVKNIPNDKKVWVFLLYQNDGNFWGFE
jgi:hypothetical protein